MSKAPAIRENPIVYSWIDPRLIDGEPAAAALSAVDQLSGLLEILPLAAATAEVMVRNASMTEGLSHNEANDPAAWWAESEQRQFLEAALSNLAEVQRWANRIVTVYRDTRA